MRSIALRYGAIMFAGFVAYFLLMHATHLSDNYNFRILNGLIHITLMSLAIRRFMKSAPEEFNYISAAVMGIITSAVGVIPFAIFQLIFLSINTEFMESLRQQVPFVGSYMTPYTSALIILVEGMAVSILASYVVMRVVDSFRSKA